MPHVSRGEPLVGQDACNRVAHVPIVNDLGASEAREFEARWQRRHFPSHEAGCYRPRRALIFEIILGGLCSWRRPWFKKALAAGLKLFPRSLAWLAWRPARGFSHNRSSWLLSTIHKIKDVNLEIYRSRVVSTTTLFSTASLLATRVIGVGMFPVRYRVLVL